MLNTYHGWIPTIQIQWLIESRGWNIPIWGMKDKPLKLLGKKLSFNLKEKSIFFPCESVLELPAFMVSRADRKLQHSSRNSLGSWEGRYNCVYPSPEHDRSFCSTCPCKTHWWTSSLVPAKQHNLLALETVCTPCTLLWTYKPTSNVVTEI